VIISTNSENLKKVGLADLEIIGLIKIVTEQQQQQQPFYGHYTGQPALAGTCS